MFRFLSHSSCTTQNKILSHQHLYRILHRNSIGTTYLKMAASQAAHLAEKAIGHDDNATTAQDVSTFPDAGESDRMNALVWMGKNRVEIGTSIDHLTRGKQSA